MTFSKIEMKNTSRALFLVTGLPLIIYPFVLLAGIMSLAGERSPNEPALLVFVAFSFLLSSIAYPGVYIPCLIAARTAAKRNNRKNEMTMAYVPLAYLVGVTALMLLWLSVEP